MIKKFKQKKYATISLIMAIVSMLAVLYLVLFLKADKLQLVLAINLITINLITILFSLSLVLDRHGKY